MRGGHPWHVTSFELQLAPTIAAAGQARAAIRAWLDGRDVDGRLLDVALLVVSELVTNSIRHALTASEDPLRLRARLQGEVLRLELQDGGTEGTVARRAPQASGGRIGGYGLDLVARLATDWGVERDAAGTVVWADLPA